MLLEEFSFKARESSIEVNGIHHPINASLLVMYVLARRSLKTVVTTFQKGWMQSITNFENSFELIPLLCHLATELEGQIADVECVHLVITANRAATVKGRDKADDVATLLPDIQRVLCSLYFFLVFFDIAPSYHKIVSNLAGKSSSEGATNHSSVQIQSNQAIHDGLQPPPHSVLYNCPASRTVFNEFITTLLSN